MKRRNKDCPLPSRSLSNFCLPPPFLQAIGCDFQCDNTHTYLLAGQENESGAWEIVLTFTLIICIVVYMNHGQAIGVSIESKDVNQVIR